MYYIIIISVFLSLTHTPYVRSDVVRAILTRIIYKSRGARTSGFAIIGLVESKPVVDLATDQMYTPPTAPIPSSDTQFSDYKNT